MEHDVKALLRQVNLVKKAGVQLEGVPRAQLPHVSGIRFDCSHGIASVMGGAQEIAATAPYLQESTAWGVAPQPSQAKSGRDRVILGCVEVRPIMRPEQGKRINVHDSAITHPATVARFRPNGSTISRVADAAVAWNGVDRALRYVAL
jgi:hypothetical protein